VITAVVGPAVVIVFEGTRRPRRGPLRPHQRAPRGLRRA
jgi:hypothetical protein